MVEWETTTIGECAEIISGGTPSTTVTDYWDGNISWCTPTDITKAKSKYLSATERTISDKGLQQSAAVLLPIGTILLCSRATVGEMCIAEKPIATNQGFKNLICNEKVNNEFLYYLLQTKVNTMLELAIGSTFLEISKKALASIEIKLPPLPEQRRIAAALSDMDALITALEKLIAKNRNIKQGAMKELLTGKRRLPGFSGNIKLLELQSLCSVFCDGDWIETKDQSDSGIRLIQTGNIGNGYFINKHDRKRYISEETFNSLNCFEVFPGDILISRLPDPAGRSCIVPQSVDRMITAVDCTVIRFIDYSPVLFVMFTQTNQYQRQVDLLMAGSTRQRIGRKELGGIKIPVFPSTQEQTAIAQILSGMDAEIDALAAKLAKLKYIKQGMMSELLTGKIRLAEQEMEVAPVAKIIELPKQESVTEKPHHSYSEGYEDAVILVALVNLFGTEQYPFTAFDCQKFPYLFHRHLEGVAKGYKKFAAGPYNPSLKYKTARPIALKKNYVRECVSKYKGLVISENAQEALGYFAKWYGDEPLKWLEQFRKIPGRKNELELLTTTDKAMVELRNMGKPITLQAVKDIIKKSPAWKDKLKRPIFSDENIIRAINWSNDLFGQALLQGNNLP
jgi:type I restriction enzyme S subunit